MQNQTKLFLLSGELRSEQIRTVDQAKFSHITSNSRMISLFGAVSSPMYHKRLLVLFHIKTFRLFHFIVPFLFLNSRLLHACISRRNRESIA